MAYAMLAMVAVLSLIPSPEMGGSDKLLHFITYFFLSAIFTTLTRLNRNLFTVAAGLIGYGILLEFLQGLTGYRFMEGADILANSAGVLCGLLIRITSIPAWFRRIELRLFNRS